MKDIFIIEFISDKGTNYTVKKAFPTEEKAETYAVRQKVFLNNLGEIEKIRVITISKLETV